MPSEPLDTAPHRAPLDLWHNPRLFEPPKTYPAEGFERPGVRGLFFEHEPFHGKPTRVFAWVGLPYLAPGRRCPAVVLLHGGGGTAFDEWVRIWNRRGYAAITFDQCGCVPEIPEPTGVLPHERHEHAGPAGWDASFDHVDDPLEEQWQYHAVSAAIRAHSLLASMPEVDETRIGVTGISWGGYLTCLVAAADPRLKCAVPVYGCGFLGENSVWNDAVFPAKERTAVNRWLSLWDPSRFLPHAQEPFCWVSGTNDLAYPLDSLEKSYHLTPSPGSRCIRIEMRHSHPDGWAPVEIGVFIDSVLGGGAPLPRIRDHRIESGEMRVGFESARPILRAELIATRAKGHWMDRKYRALPAELDARRGLASAALPTGTTVCFMNLYDDRGCVSSSPLVFPQGLEFPG
jgi:dienelactone hydrolase